MSAQQSTSSDGKSGGKGSQTAPSGRGRRTWTPSSMSARSHAKERCISMTTTLGSCTMLGSTVVVARRFRARISSGAHTSPQPQTAAPRYAGAAGKADHARAAERRGTAELGQKFGGAARRSLPQGGMRRADADLAPSWAAHARMSRDFSPSK